MKRAILGIVVISIFAAVLWNLRTTDTPEIQSQNDALTVNAAPGESTHATKDSLNQVLAEQDSTPDESPQDISEALESDTDAPPSTRPTPTVQDTPKATDNDAAVGIQETITAYLEAGLTGDKEAAAKVATPNAKSGSVVEDIEGLQELWSESEDFTVDIYANDSNGLAVSNLLNSPWENQPSMYLVFTFQIEPDGKWYISDIDAEDFDGAEKSIKRFLKENNDVRLIENVTP